MRIVRTALIATPVAILLQVQPGTCLAGANPHFLLPLHAKVDAAARCRDYLPVNCVDHAPTVTVPPETDIVVYLMLFNHTAVAGLQCALEWPTWTVQDQPALCLPGILSDVGIEDPGGPVRGTIAVAFANCVTGPALAVYAKIVFRTGTSGCLYYVQPAFPWGTATIDCANQRDLIDANDPQGQRRLGRICVGDGGHDPCEALTPTSQDTWGAIKGSYR